MWTLSKEHRRGNSEPGLALTAGMCSADTTPTLLHTYKALLTLRHLFTALPLSKDDHRIIYSRTSVKGLGFETDARRSFHRFTVILSCDPRHRSLKHRRIVQSKELLPLFRLFDVIQRGREAKKTNQRFMNETAKREEN